MTRLATPTQLIKENRTELKEKLKLLLKRNYEKGREDCYSRY